jgi:hypothetical protein
MSNASIKLALTCGMGLLVAAAADSFAQSANEGLWQDLFGPAPSVPADSTRNFRIGALVGFNFKADFSMSGTFSVSGNNPGPTGQRGANHEYDDGFVRVDITGNDQNSTWYWSYENASQVQGQQLHFHSADSFTTSGSASDKSGASVGFDSAYGGRLGRLWGGAVGWELGFGLLPIKITDNQSMNAMANQTEHWYDISGITIPSAPYEGSYEGPSTKLNDLANPGAGSGSVPATLTGSRTLDVMLYNIRLGPTLQWELHPRFAVAVSAGAAFGIVSGDLKFDERLEINGTTAINQGSSGSTEFVYGGYVAGTLLYHAVKNGDIYVGFQYMPMTSATFSGNNREAKLDMTGGLYISAGFNWPF